MTRTNLVLLVALIGSSLYLVRASYEARNLFVQLDRARNEHHALDLDHDRLLVERRAQATPLRVERVARDQLSMRTATPAVTQYVTQHGAQHGTPQATPHGAVPAAAPRAASAPSLASAPAATTATSSAPARPMSASGVRP